jgi:Cu/Ag efflux pump CusA
LIFGTLAATLLTLVVVPLLYAMMRRSELRGSEQKTPTQIPLGGI